MAYQNSRNNNDTLILKCNDCGSSDIKRRKNFSHGSKSKAKLSFMCNKCGSSKISKESSRFRRR